MRSPLLFNSTLLAALLFTLPGGAQDHARHHHHAGHTFGREALAALARPAIERAAPGCTAEDLALPDHLTLASADVAATAELTQPRTTSARIVAAVTLSDGVTTTRLPVPVRLTCEPPTVSPGADVTIVARAGNVRATAPGIATQPGRVGDVVRVTCLTTHTTLEARVVDAHTVEVHR